MRAGGLEQPEGVDRHAGNVRLSMKAAVVPEQRRRRHEIAERKRDRRLQVQIRPIMA
jgi:hypothetical protein